MTFAELKKKVEALNGLFVPRRSADKPHFELVTSNRRAGLIRWTIGTDLVAKSHNVTPESLQPEAMGAFLDAYTLGMEDGIEEGEKRGFAKGRRAWNEIDPSVGRKKR